MGLHILNVPFWDAGVLFEKESLAWTGEYKSNYKHKLIITFKFFFKTQSCTVTLRSQTVHKKKTKLTQENTASTHVKTHKLLQTCKQVVTSLFTSC